MTRMTCSVGDKLNSATNQICFFRRDYFILILKSCFEDLRNGELEILTVGAEGAHLSQCDGHNVVAWTQRCWMASDNHQILLFINGGRNSSAFIQRLQESPSPGKLTSLFSEDFQITVSLQLMSHIRLALKFKSLQRPIKMGVCSPS